MEILSAAEALKSGIGLLRDISPSPELDAQLLLTYCTGYDRMSLVMSPEAKVSPEQYQQYLDFIERRKLREPVAYITGHKQFWGLDLEVTPDVLIPRPETELIIEAALTMIVDKADPLLVLDLGTGSGCISVALGFELKRRQRNFLMVSVDRSLAALRVAQSNAQKFDLQNYIEFVCANWGLALRQDFDLIVSNPPYLFEGDNEISYELNFEPSAALYSGKDGLSDYRKIFEQLNQLLAPQGTFLGEIGYGQAIDLREMAEQALPDAKIDFHPDIRGIPRVIEIQK